MCYKLQNKCDPINLIFLLFILFGCITDDAVEKNDLKLELEINPEITNIISSLFVLAIQYMPTTINDYIHDFVIDNERLYEDFPLYEKVWNNI